MHRYFIKIPFFIRWLFPHYLWRVLVQQKKVYLSFDDGPHPYITPWVLKQLARYNAKASFFCIGKNVVLYPDVYGDIIANGHAVGNHTQHHLNGWKCDDETYVQDVAEAGKYIASDLFRPPYGRIRKKQAKALRERCNKKMQIVMWDVLSGDFDVAFSPGQCLQNVIKNISPGSIIVFHDSEKAWKNLKPMLPELLEYLKKNGYKCEAL